MISSAVTSAYGLNSIYCLFKQLLANAMARVMAKCQIWFIIPFMLEFLRMNYHPHTALNSNEFNPFFVVKHAVSYQLSHSMLCFNVPIHLNRSRNSFTQFLNKVQWKKYDSGRNFEWNLKC